MVISKMNILWTYVEQCLWFLGFLFVLLFDEGNGEFLGILLSCQGLSLMLRFLTVSDICCLLYTIFRVTLIQLSKHSSCHLKYYPRIFNCLRHIRLALHHSESYSYSDCWGYKVLKIQQESLKIILKKT